MTILRCLCAALLLSAAPVAHAERALTLNRRALTLEDGALRVDLHEATLDERKLFVVSAALPATSDFQVRTHPTPAPLGEIVGAGSLVAINGGFYDPQGRPMGLVVQDGEAVHRLRRGGGSGVLLRDSERFRVVHRDHVPQNGVRQALQSIDRIVDRGTSLVGPGSSPARDARSAIATFEDGSARLYAVFAPDSVDARDCGDDGCVFRLSARSSSEGVSLRELADFLVAQGAEAALNLDGGHSTSFIARLGGRELRVVGFGLTINALVARPSLASASPEPDSGARR